MRLHVLNYACEVLGINSRLFSMRVSSRSSKGQSAILLRSVSSVCFG